MRKYLIFGLFTLLSAACARPAAQVEKVEEKYPGQFTDDVEKAWQGNVVYKWDGSEMVLGPMDVDAFVKLPMYFVHAQTDKTCKVASTYAYAEGSPMQWIVAQFEK